MSRLRRRPSAPTVIALIALFVALQGQAVARVVFGTSAIKDSAITRQDQEQRGHEREDQERHDSEGRHRRGRGLLNDRTIESGSGGSTTYDATTLGSFVVGPGGHQTVDPVTGTSGQGRYELQFSHATTATAHLATVWISLLYKDADINSGSSTAYAQALEASEPVG